MPLDAQLRARAIMDAAAADAAPVKRLSGHRWAAPLLTVMSPVLTRRDCKLFAVERLVGVSR